MDAYHGSSRARRKKWGKINMQKETDCICLHLLMLCARWVPRQIETFLIRVIVFTGFLSLRLMQPMVLDVED